eukprot:403364693
MGASKTKEQKPLTVNQQARDANIYEQQKPNANGQNISGQGNKTEIKSKTMKISNNGQGNLEDFDPLPFEDNLGNPVPASHTKHKTQPYNTLHHHLQQSQSQQSHYPHHNNSPVQEVPSPTKTIPDNYNNSTTNNDNNDRKSLSYSPFQSETLNTYSNQTKSPVWAKNSGAGQRNVGISTFGLNLKKIIGDKFINKLDEKIKEIHGPGKNLKYFKYPPKKVNIQKFEHWHMIFDFLDMRALVKCAGVSKYWFIQCSKDYLYNKFGASTHHEIESSQFLEDDYQEDGEDSGDDDNYSSYRSTNPKTLQKTAAQKLVNDLKKGYSQPASIMNQNEGNQPGLHKNSTSPLKMKHLTTNSSGRLNSITETFNEQSDADMSSIDKKQRSAMSLDPQVHIIREEDEMSLENSTLTKQHNNDGHHNIMYLDNKGSTNLTRNQTINSKVSGQENPLSTYVQNNNTTQHETISNQPSKMLLKESYHYGGSVIGNQNPGGMPIIRIFEEQDRGAMTLTMSREGEEKSKSSGGLINFGGGNLTDSPVSELDHQLKNQINQIYGNNPQKANQIHKQIKNEQKMDKDKQEAYSQFKEIYERRLRDQEHYENQFSVIHEESNSKSGGTTTSIDGQNLRNHKIYKGMGKEQFKMNQMLIIEKSSMDSSSYNDLNTLSPSKYSNQLEVPASPEKILGQLMTKDKNVFNYEQLPPEFTKIPMTFNQQHLEKQKQFQQNHHQNISPQQQQQHHQKSKKLFEFQPSYLEKDPITGAYKPKELIEIAEMKDITDHRQQAMKANYYHKKQEQMSLLRMEMRNKKQRDAEERKKEANMKYLMTDNLEKERGVKLPVIDKPEVSDAKRVQFENMQTQVMRNIYYDPQQYKNLLMKFICEGYSSEVRRLLRDAPDEPSYLDCREFYFGMFMHSIDKNKESKMISPIAVAVNVGDYELVDDLLNYLQNINIEFGIETRMKTQTILRQNQQNTVRKKSPLQYACSLGLYQIVERLLQAGANPNNVPEDEKMILIEYGINPLVICMNPKHHNQDLSIDGLTFKRKFTPLKDVDHELCMKLLLKYKADPDVSLGQHKRRRPMPIFHAIKRAKILKTFIDNLDDKSTVLNQANFYQETPLCLVAGEPGGQDNEFKAKILLQNGASSFASELNPLHIAVKNKNYKIMRLLYKQGDASPSRNLGNEITPIQLAVRHQDGNLVRELLQWKDSQIDFEYVDNQGRNLLHIIAQNKSIDIFKSLVSETNNKYLKQISQAMNIPSKPNEPYLTPLYYCFPSLELARLYNRYGAESQRLSFLHCFFTYSKPQPWQQQSDSEQDSKKKQNTPNQGNTLEYLTFLVKEFKLDVDELDIDGKSALVHAYEDYRKDTMSFLIGLSADMEIGCLGQGKTMLLDAFHKGFIDLVQFLLQKGANVETKDSRGKTIQDYIKTDYEGKTPQIKQELNQLLYKHTLSKPFKQPIQSQSVGKTNQTTRDSSVNNSYASVHNGNKTMTKNETNRRKSLTNQQQNAIALNNSNINSIPSRNGAMIMGGAANNYNSVDVVGDRNFNNMDGYKNNGSMINQYTLNQARHINVNYANNQAIIGGNNYQGNSNGQIMYNQQQKSRINSNSFIYNNISRL